MNLQDRYDELDTIVRELDYLISEISDKDYKEQLELIKYEAQDDLDEIEEDVIAEQEEEARYQILEYERSVV